MYKRKNKLLKRIIMFVLFIVLMFFLLLFLKAYMPSFKKINYRESVYLAKDEIGINMQTDYISMKNPPIYENNEIYLPVDFIKQYIDKYIHWDEDENTLTITNENNVITMQTDEIEYFVNNTPLELDLPAYNIDGVAYVPKLFLEDFYGLKFKYIEDTKMLSIAKSDYKKATLGKNVKLRKEASKKSPYIEKLKEGDNVYFNNESQEEYTKVEADSGYVGFVPTKILKNIEEVNINNNYKEDYIKKSPWKVEEGKINLVFDQVQRVEANNTESRRKYIDGIDVLVPTWFSFKDESGKIANIADKSYVDFAHNNGYKVWGLLTDNFDRKISHSILSSTKTRHYVIKQLLAFVSIYDLDGINIDFESVPQEDGENFIQFLRELAPALKKEGVVLSVDLFVPKPWTNHYNRKEVGKIVDYVIVMGYDEHYAGSKEAGSVASMFWSELAIKDTLAEGVPKDKLILGIPFYTRVWTETLENGEIKLGSKAYGMNGSYKFIEEKNGTFTFDEKTGQVYGEAKEDKKTYKVWLEDEESVKKRLDFVLQYDIAGIGAWKKGLEKEEIWDILKEKLKE